jgi:hypothetical protein
LSTTAGQPVCFVGVPHRGWISAETVGALLNTGTQVRAVPLLSLGSLLDHNFNVLLAVA